MSQPACKISSIFTRLLWLRSVLEPDSLWRPVFAVHCWLSHMCALKVSFLLFMIGDWCVAINNGFYYLQSNNQRLLPLLPVHRKQRLTKRAWIHMEMIYYPPVHAKILPPVDLFLFPVALFETVAFSHAFTACMLMKVWAICLLFFQVEKHQSGQWIPGKPRNVLVFTKVRYFIILVLFMLLWTFLNSHVSISLDTWMLKRKNSWS